MVMEVVQPETEPLEGISTSPSTCEANMGPMHTPTAYSRLCVPHGQSGDKFAHGGGLVSSTCH